MGLHVRAGERREPVQLRRALRLGLTQRAALPSELENWSQDLTTDKANSSADIDSIATGFPPVKPQTTPPPRGGTPRDCEGSAQTYLATC